MAKLLYTALASLDGFIEDPHGGFGWAMPDPEVHAFANQLEASISTHLYGRRMYETMAVWQDVGEGPDVHPIEAEYGAQWRGLDKVVHSRTLEDVWTPRTTLVRGFDPAAVAEMKRTSDGDISVSGPGLASHAFAAGLVDEVHLFLFPIVVGGGKPALPRDRTIELELVDEHRFGIGVVHLHHVVA